MIHTIRHISLLNIMARLLLLLLAVFPFWECGYDGALAQVSQMMFERLDKTRGLGDNRVYHILQLPDGRMAVTTHDKLCIYNGVHFKDIRLDASKGMTLSGYHGAYHVYADSHQRLWIKDYQRVKCLDLRAFRFISNVDSILATELGDKKPRSVQDLFVDADGKLWVTDDKNRVVTKALATPIIYNGELQDVATVKGKVFLFTNDMKVSAYSLSKAKEDFTAVAKCTSNYSTTSLVIMAGNGKFYQLRNGKTGGVCLCLDINTKEWQVLFETPSTLHTISADSHFAYITSQDKMWQVNLADNSVEDVESINLNGTHITPGHMNSVCVDNQGGIWLGSYTSGLLYTHPSKSVLGSDASMGIEDYANVNELNVGRYELRPILVSANSGGEEIDMSSVTDSIYIKYDKLTLTYSALNYAQPQLTHFFVRIKELGNHWVDIGNLSGTHKGVGDLPYPIDGVTKRDAILTFTIDCHDGPYHIEVAASLSERPENLHPVSLTVEAEPWWWNPPLWAGILTFLVVSVLYHIYGQRFFDHMGHKEEKETPEEKEQLQETVEETTATLSASDKAFLDKATELVFANVANSDYGVEQLSNDLCMERTGLYKKLGQLLNVSPSAFIRGIRLRKAVELLKTEQYSVSDVAEQCGFSSSSYMSKCFKSEFGKTPLEYVKQ